MLSATTPFYLASVPFFKDPETVYNLCTCLHVEENFNRILDVQTMSKIKSKPIQNHVKRAADHVPCAWTMSRVCGHLACVDRASHVCEPHILHVAVHGPRAPAERARPCMGCALLSIGGPNRGAHPNIYFYRMKYENFV